MQLHAAFHRVFLPRLLSTQAIAAVASAPWRSDAGANLAIGGKVGDEALPKIVAGGDGSAWITWFDSASGNDDVNAHEFDPQGVEVFPHNGLLVSGNPQSTSLLD